MARVLLPDQDPESSGAEWAPESGAPGSQPGEASATRSWGRRWRHLMAGTVIGFAGIVLVVGLSPWARKSAEDVRVGAESLVELDNASAAPTDPCADFPFYRIEKVLHSNLGGKGPDDGEEGIVFDVTTSHTGLGLNGSHFELHMHATSEYHPSWPKENGFDKHFARVNLKPGTNVSLEAYVLDPATNETAILPQGSVTFFDLDKGKNATEFVTSSGFTEIVLSNETELERFENPDGSSTIRATVRGNGDDNPANPLELDVLQKNRAVTFMYEKVEKLNFVLGCTDGDETRVFSFVIRPALLCAGTRLSDGSVVSAANSPISAVRYSVAGALGTKRLDKSGSSRAVATGLGFLGLIFLPVFMP